MLKIKLSFLSLFIFLLCNSQEKEQELKTYTFSQADSIQNQQAHKLIFVFIHTDWCGVCKRMELTTFKDQEVINLMNKKILFVPFNAENHKETIHFRGLNYVFEPKGTAYGTHQLAKILGTANGRLAYPTLLFINKENEINFRLSSYLNAKRLIRLLSKL